MERLFSIFVSIYPSIASSGQFHIIIYIHAFFAPLCLLCYDGIRGLLPYPIQHIYLLSNLLFLYSDNVYGFLFALPEYNHMRLKLCRSFQAEFRLCMNKKDRPEWNKLYKKVLNFLKYAKRSLYDRIKKKLLILQDGFSLYPAPNQIIAKGQGYCNDEWSGNL